MPRRIIWSPNADKDLAVILNYLNKNWDKKVAIHFLDKVDLMTKMIAESPNQFPEINKDLKIRKCVVTSKIPFTTELSITTLKSSVSLMSARIPGS